MASPCFPSQFRLYDKMCHVFFGGMVKPRRYPWLILLFGVDADVIMINTSIQFDMIVMFDIVNEGKNENNCQCCSPKSQSDKRVLQLAAPTPTERRRVSVA